MAVMLLIAAVRARCIVAEEAVEHTPQCRAGQQFLRRVLQLQAVIQLPRRNGARLRRQFVQRALIAAHMPAHTQRHHRAGQQRQAGQQQRAALTHHRQWRAA